MQAKFLVPSSWYRVLGTKYLAPSNPLTVSRRMWGGRGVGSAKAKASHEHLTNCCMARDVKLALAEIRRMARDVELALADLAISLPKFFIVSVLK